MAKPDLRVIKSRRDIEAAFVTLIQREGFAAITVKEICAESLTGRSTFYRYYQDKYDLLTQLVQRQTAEFDQLLTQRLAAVRGDQLLNGLYTALAEHRQLILALLTVHEEAGDLRQAFTEVLERQLGEFLQQFETPVTTDFLAQLYAANVLTALTWSLQHTVDPAITRFMNELFNHLATQYHNQ